MILQKDIRSEFSDNDLVVIHPLFDVPEEKCSTVGLGEMTMSPSVRFSLILLRAYLILMGILLAYHMLDLGGFLGRHIGK